MESKSYRSVVLLKMTRFDDNIINALHACARGVTTAVCTDLSEKKKIVQTCQLVLWHTESKAEFTEVLQIRCTQEQLVLFFILQGQCQHVVQYLLCVCICSKFAAFKSSLYHEMNLPAFLIFNSSCTIIILFPLSVHYSKVSLL